MLRIPPSTLPISSSSPSPSSSFRGARIKMSYNLSSGFLECAHLLLASCLGGWRCTICIVIPLPHFPLVHIVHYFIIPHLASSSLVSNGFPSFSRIGFVLVHLLYFYQYQHPIPTRSSSSSHLSSRSSSHSLSLFPLVPSSSSLFSSLFCRWLR